MRQLGRFAEKQILDDEKIELLERRMNFFQIRVGLSHVISDNPETLERSRQRGIPHVRRLHAAGRWQGPSCDCEMRRRQRWIRKRLIPGKECGQAADIRCPLHIVLPAQGVDPGTGLPDVAGRQREIHQRHHPMASPAMFGHAQAMHRHGAAACGISSRGFGDEMSGHAGQPRRQFRSTTLHHIEPFLEPLGPVTHECRIGQMFLRDDMAHAIQQRHVCTRMQLKMKIGQPG